MKSRTQRTFLFVTLTACIMVTAVAVVTAVFIAGQRPVVVVVPAQAPAAAPAASHPGTADMMAASATAVPVVSAASSTAPAPAAAAAAPPPPAAPELQVVRVDSAPALDNPDDPSWDRAPMIQVPLQPQQTAHPMLDTATISSVNVQALRDQHRIVWRISWEQPTPAQIANVGRFPDGAAIQFPMVDGAPFTMGAPDMPVRVLYWKALWQKDISEGFQDVHHQYANAWSDLYWFAEGEAPFPLAEAFARPEAREWLIAYRAGNSMADFERPAPVEELVAEGLGTVTHVPDTPSNAHGVWKDGRWSVMIDRPLDPGDPIAHRLNGGGQVAISLAVWDGSAGNVGARKHWCNWIPMRME
jgi:DMSO reductase family type II enzyme heme b subunit